MTIGSSPSGRPSSSASGGAPSNWIVDLTDERATDARLVGAKAANLARCAAAGLPTLPGFVVTTSAVATLDDQPPDGRLPTALSSAWADLTGRQEGPVIVRSSSTAEDLAESSMAGRFVSMLDVRDRDAFLAAVRTVARSAAAAADGALPLPMAVLVQPQLDVSFGGVLFGVDPVTGDRRHVVAEVVPSRVDDLVSGAASAAHYVLAHSGRIVDRSNVAAAPRLTALVRRRLVRLSIETQQALGGDQDVEWAVDRHGRLWLLQSRPITAIAERAGSPRVYGPGPVAETFPDPLRTLEQDLWLEPLRDGIERALRATGAVTDRDLAASPILVAVDGWAAMDLDLTGVVIGRPRFRDRIAPSGIVRRLATAWRVGRLRVAFPRLAEELVATIDADLSAVPSVNELDDVVLVDLLRRGRRELATAHQYEVLSGMLLHRDGAGPPASLIALDALVDARRRGWSDEMAIERAPILLALTPPSWEPPALPPGIASGSGDPRGLEALGTREALRLRCRWLQELLAVAARSLGERLSDDGTIERPDLVRELTLDELAGVLTNGDTVGDLEVRRRVPAGAPLPPQFRLGRTGTVLPVHVAHDAVGLPAVAGRAVGTARHRLAPGTPKSGHVLVVEHLEPSLASLLPSLDALVAETGSALSHVAILAREIGLPTVVGVPDARRRFPPGTRLLVDGGTGDVCVLPADHHAATGAVSEMAR